MSALRQRMLEDMKLANLAPETQRAYVRAVRKLAEHYHHPPDTLSEQEVRSYLLSLRDRGVARGTFRSARFALQFFFGRSLGRDWLLFKQTIRSPQQKRLPEALSDEQVRRLLSRVRNPVHRGCLFNAAGCRIELTLFRFESAEDIHPLDNRVARCRGESLVRHKLLELGGRIHVGIRQILADVLKQDVALIPKRIMASFQFQQFAEPGELLPLEARIAFQFSKVGWFDRASQRCIPDGRGNGRADGPV